MRVEELIVKKGTPTSGSVDFSKIYELKTATLNTFEDIHERLCNMRTELLSTNYLETAVKIAKIVRNIAWVSSVTIFTVHTS